MSLPSLRFLANYYNMTVHTHRRRDYLLEINPNYVDGSFNDKYNVIDGRWIDITTGLFIDVTAVRPKPRARGILVTKDKHEEKVCITCVRQRRNGNSSMAA